MRCLYCGKELALFKRLRGGEFCSDAHRQRYQEEYTQLALNRLLQANSAPEAAPEPAPETAPKGPAPSKGKDSKSFPPRPMEDLESPALRRRESQMRRQAPATLSKTPPTTAPPIIMPAASAPQPAPQAARSATADAAHGTDAKNGIAVAPPAVVVEEVPPARATGIRLALPRPVTPAAPPIAHPESRWSSSSAPSLPRLHNAAQNADTGLTPAGRISPEPPELADFYAAPRERALEVRDFVRSIPVAEINLTPAGDRGLGFSPEALPVRCDSHPPRGAARPSQEDHREFAVPRVTLGELARLDFEVTDWDEEPVTRVEAEPPVAVPESALPEPVQTAPVQIDPTPMKPVEFERVRPAPVHFEPVRIEPVFMERIAALSAPEAVVEKPAEVRAPEPASPPQPEAPRQAVTKPLPVTLHGLAPVPGKPAQVFSSALVRTGEIQTPRQNSLPLRPAIVLTPAAAEVKTPAEKPARPERAAEKQDSRPAPEKPRKGESRVLSLHLTDDAKPEQVKPEQVKPEQVKKALAKARPEPASEKPRASEKPKSRPAAAEPEKETALVSAPPASAEPDLLGLPKLSLETSGGTWSRLGMGARIGVAAAVLAAIAGGIFLNSRGSSAPRNTGPVRTEPVLVEAGPALAADAGWITDWFSDARALGQESRHVDVMRGSLTLRDYRLELEGQIDQGGLGWVFRANNRKNFYVEKIQMVKPGLEPDIALVRFAMIDGKEQPRRQIPLPIKAHLDTYYKIRLDAVGHRFTTYVQNQQMDQWTDDRIEVGGVGMYYDPGDSARLKGTLHIVPLKER